MHKWRCRIRRIMLEFLYGNDVWCICVDTCLVIFEFTSPDVAGSRCSKVAWCILIRESCLKHLTTDLYQNADTRSFFPSKTNFGVQRVVETRICGVMLGVSWRPHLTWMWDVRTSNCEAEFRIRIVMNKNPQCVHCLWKWRHALWMGRRWHEIDMFEGMIQIGEQFQARRIGLWEKEGLITTMRIVTYNINGLRTRLVPPRTLLSFLDSLESDIICFQVLTSLALI